MSVVLHKSTDVLSFRHGVSWLLLAFAAGAVNAGAFIASSRFVSHVTGIITNIGLDFGSWMLMVDYALVLTSFIAGAVLSVLLIQGRALRGKQPLHALALVLVSVILALAGVLGKFEFFGPMGGEVEQPADFALLCVLALAMGLMNATVATSTGNAVRTTHATGPATDFGVHLAAAWLTTGEDRKMALRNAVLRGSKITAFGIGAAAMVPAMKSIGYVGFLMPATMILVATMRSFVQPSASVNESVAQREAVARQTVRS